MSFKIPLLLLLPEPSSLIIPIFIKSTVCNNEDHIKMTMWWELQKIVILIYALVIVNVQSVAKQNQLFWITGLSFGAIFDVFLIPTDQNRQIMYHKNTWTFTLVHYSRLTRQVISAISRQVKSSGRFSLFSDIKLMII